MLKIIAGTFIGGVIGYVYYRFIGCSTGVCPIASNPWLSTLLWAFMGFMVASMVVAK